MCKNKRVLTALLELSKSPVPEFDSDLGFTEMIGYTVTHVDNVEFLDWVSRNSTKPKHRMITEAQFTVLAELGHVDVVRWVDDHSYELPAKMLAIAAGKGNLPLVRFLHEHGTKSCVNLAIAYAGQFGHLDSVKFLHEHRGETICNHQITSLHLHGRLDERCASYLLSFAAMKGYLECIKYAHEHNFDGFTSNVMTDATIFGHVDIVKFLHENRTEGCTRNVLFSRHGNVVQYLYRHRPIRKSESQRPIKESQTNKLLGSLERLFRWDVGPKTTETCEYY